MRSHRSYQTFSVEQCGFEYISTNHHLMNESINQQNSPGYTGSVKNDIYREDMETDLKTGLSVVHNFQRIVWDTLPLAVASDNYEVGNIAEWIQ